MTAVDTGLEKARDSSPKRPRLLLSFLGSAFGVMGGEREVEGAVVDRGCDVDAFSSREPTLPVRLESAWLSYEGLRAAPASCNVCRASVCLTVHPSLDAH